MNVDQQAHRMRVKQILHWGKQEIEKVFMRMEQELCADFAEPIPIFTLIEQRFCRAFSPNELETIRDWMDRYPPDVIEMAVNEAYERQKLNIRYIDRILLTWEKAGVKDAKGAIEYMQSFQQRATPNVAPQQVPNMQIDVVPSIEVDIKPKVPFYNWLEERG